MIHSDMAILLEIAAVVFGILYVLLAAKKNIWCWLMGIIGSILSIFLFVMYSKLYAEALLSFYYVVTGIIGWMQWGRSDTNLRIARKPIKSHILVISISVAGAFFLNFIINALFEDAEMALLDSFTTSFSFVTTILVMRRWMSNWIYWIIIDAVTAVLYISRDLYVYALLMIAYTFLAAYGWQQWKKQFDEQA